MKVLHVFKTYLPDSFTGMERVIWEIAEGTFALGVQSEVFTLSRRPSGHPLDIGHHRVNQARQHLYLASTGVSLSAFGTFARLARASDIVHYHFPWPMMDVLHLLCRHGKPSVVTYHSDIVRQAKMGHLYRPLMMRFLDAADAIVATSPNYLETSEVLQRYRNKVEVIPLGLRPRSAPDPERVASWRERLGEGFFLFVGALRYYKGLKDLIEAARVTSLPVVIVGEGEMHRYLAEAGVPNVVLLGTVDDADKEALLELCAAFVFPSYLRSEAYGLALAEAARAGKAMITCELGTGTSFVNRDGETGLVISPGNPALLADAMRTLWQDRELARRMGHAAAERFARELTAEAMCRGYEKLYATVTPRVPGGKERHFRAPVL